MYPKNGYPCFIIKLNVKDDLFVFLQFNQDYFLFSYITCCFILLSFFSFCHALQFRGQFRTIE